MILVTGGAGFIGGNFILDWLSNPKNESVINLDKLTYAGNLPTLKSLSLDARHVFVQGDIADSQLVFSLLNKHQVRAIINFASESHVDRSIHSPRDFITTNIVGTFGLLEAAQAYWSNLSIEKKMTFRFLHVSTDEVYGTLEKDDSTFSEFSHYKPNNPYSASKAASNHLVRAWYVTYGLPVLTTISSNNYGPYQFPDKLIPLVINNALAGKLLPIYGDGQQIRDWLHVKDHCSAIRKVLEVGRIGETYNVGSQNQKTNIDVVKKICLILDELNSDRSDSYVNLITFVKDRPGHDYRYAVDTTKIQRELGWGPIETFDAGIKKTVKWYLDNQDWVQGVQASFYRYFSSEKDE
jgi:dTDP-glucose 4,6-dehydratase